MSIHSSGAPARPRKPRAWALTGLLLAAGAVGVPAAQAQPVPGATYTGTITGGGNVDFDVASSGKAVTRFRASDVPGHAVLATCTSSWLGTGTFPIINNAFEASGIGTITTFEFKGTFPAPQQAQGTVEVNSLNCPSDTLSWVASTTATPPPAPDRTGPGVTLSYTKRQTPAAARSRGLAVKVTCTTEPCTASTSGRVTGRSRRAAVTSYKLRAPASRKLARGVTATFRLRLSKAGADGLRRALRAHPKVAVPASVLVRAVDAAGNPTLRTAKFLIR
ncbi:MAG: hypothetical protein ACXVFN_17190 [Solirubrobacteraceae bacterium]